MNLTKGGFDILRAEFGFLKQSQVDAINFIVSAIDKDKSISYQQAAYMLATAWHETAKTMQPIEEYGKGKGLIYGTWYLNNKKQKYCFSNGLKTQVYLSSEHPFLYYGRGYVQLTWLDNFKTASNKIGVDLVCNPDLALKPEYAVQIMINGMKSGWFTGWKLSDSINPSKKDYVGARRIINGSDKAQQIATYAAVFERALKCL